MTARLCHSGTGGAKIEATMNVATPRGLRLAIATGLLAVAMGATVAAPGPNPVALTASCPTAYGGENLGSGATVTGVPIEDSACTAAHGYVRVLAGAGAQPGAAVTVHFADALAKPPVCVISPTGAPSDAYVAQTNDSGFVTAFPSGVDGGADLSFRYICIG